MSQSILDPFFDQFVCQFSSLKDQIIFYFTSPIIQNGRESNLSGRVILDMALRYGLLWKSREGQEYLVPVTEKCRQAWGITEGELFALARVNTPRLLPPLLCPMREILGDMARAENEAADVELSVLTNSRRFLGAAAMLYDEVLAAFAAEIDSDFYILPSSIHEVLLLPCRGQDRQALETMVTEINAREVRKQDVLSNHVYQYQKNSGKIV